MDNFAMFEFAWKVIAIIMGFQMDLPFLKKMDAAVFVTGIGKSQIVL